MTFWLDAHIDPELAAWLGTAFNITVKPLRDIGLRDAKDQELVSAANRFGNIIIVTKDVDFFERRKLAGAPPKMVLMRCGNTTKLELRAYAVKNFAKVLQQLDAGELFVMMPALEE